MTIREAKVHCCDHKLHWGDRAGIPSRMHFSIVEPGVGECSLCLVKRILPGVR